MAFLVPSTESMWAHLLRPGPRRAWEEDVQRPAKTVQVTLGVADADALHWGLRKATLLRHRMGRALCPPDLERRPCVPGPAAVRRIT
jgi:hypothetical protein